jgi:hypothetical protein
MSRSLSYYTFFAKLLIKPTLITKCDLHTFKLQKHGTQFALECGGHGPHGGDDVFTWQPY